MSAASRVLKSSDIRWTARLIKRLRGKRTQLDFGSLLGAPKNTVWRWEAGLSHPDSNYSSLLSQLADHEHFFREWTLVGSMTLVGDLESANAEIAEVFQTSLKRTADQHFE